MTKLTTDPSNARSHGERNRAMIADSLDRFGAVRPIIIDGDNVVHAGNATYAEAEALGIPVEVIESDRSKLYAIRMTNLTPEQFREYGLIDNQSALLADWNTDELRTRLEAGDDLNRVWDAEELARLLATTDTDHDGMTVDHTAIIADEWSSETFDHAASREGTSDVYNTTTVRQVHLIMTVTEYEDLVPKMRTLMERENLETNYDVVQSAIDRWLNA